MKWRIYYGDNSTFTSSQGKPWDAPQVNVQAIAQEDKSSPTGFALQHNKDCYFWRDDIGWNGCDQAGLFDHLMFHKGPKTLLFGRSIRDEAYWDIVKRAQMEGLG